MCPKSVWSGPVSSGRYSSLHAVWWKHIQATGVWSQWSAVLTFPVSGSGVWNSASSNTLNSSSSQVPCDSSLAVIFLASSAVCGSNLDASVSFAKASSVAVFISPPTGPQALQCLVSLLFLWLYFSAAEEKSWVKDRLSFPVFLRSFILIGQLPEVLSDCFYSTFTKIHRCDPGSSAWVCPFQQGSLTYLV